VAEIGNAYNFVSSANDSSTTYVTALTIGTAAELDTSGSAEYILILEGTVGGQLLNENVYEFEVHDNGVAIPLTHSRVEPNVGAGPGPAMALVVKFTKASSGDVTLVFKSDGVNAAYVSAMEGQLLLLDDITENVDWVYAETTPTGNSPSSWTNGASVKVPEGEADTWLFFGATHWLIDSINANRSTRIHDDSASPEGLGEIRLEGEDTVEEMCDMTSVPISGSAAGSPEKTVTVQYMNSASNNNDCDSTRIFGLRKEVFKSSGIVSVSGTFGQSVSPRERYILPPLEFTVGHTGTYLTFGSAVWVGSTDNNQSFMELRHFINFGSPAPPVFDVSPTGVITGGSGVGSRVTNDRDTELVPHLHIAGDGGDYTENDENHYLLRGSVNLGAENVSGWIAVMSLELAPPASSPLPPSLTSDDFRFRNNDGSESAATWIAAQDTDITREQNQ
jgi:hypothetical protein